MSRGYGKSYRKGYSHASFQFDKLFKENSNRPSAARSAGTVGKWGITSFTSIRSSNGLPTPQYPEVTPTNKRMKLDETVQTTKSKSKDPFSFEQQQQQQQSGLSDKNSSSNIQPVKPKKFFKSRNAKPSDDVQSDSAKCSDKVDFSYGASGGGGGGGGSPTKKPKASYGAKKFFQSKRSPSPPPPASVTATAAAAAAPAAANQKREENKPPIVLRISRGKSRLLSDSDESESTPTPSSAPSSSTVTSPRSTRDSQPTRITRSTRRSMQQDLSSSPTSTEPPTETFVSLLSPEYIAPEKFELERKAMYDNLLGPSSPVDSIVSTTAPETAIITQEAEHEPESEPIFTTGSQELECSSQDTEDIVANDSQISVEEEFSQETESSGIFTQDTINNTQDSQEIIPEPLDTSTLTDNDDKEKLYEAEALLNSTKVDFSSVTDELSVPVADILKPTPSEDIAPSPPEEPVSAAAAAIVVAADTSSESDSESSQPPSSNPPTAEDPSASSANTIDQHRDEIMEKILEKPAVEAPTVKLVISKKKGSIFKSRSMVQDGSKKRHALYKHKWCDDRDLAAQKGNENLADKKDPATDSSHFDDYDFESAPLTRVTRTVNSDFSLDGPDSVTSVICNKKDKNFYTVIRNVKKAHQIQEIGEFQEFNDDVEYILDALQDNNPTGTRCLSAITLATKCMAPAFRMHVRAHGIVAKFFRALHDATKDQSLGLCTATVMFVLSQDRLNMDLDRDCLELMLNLLESDVSYQKALDECGMSSAQLHKNKLKVRELCAEIQSQGHAMHLNLDNITVGQLAMETLLSLTSKRAGEWFKEELRELGGLQHIMETICECCRQVSDYVVVWTETLLDKLRKVDRCMRVLENVTQNNEQNQTYLLQYNNGIILDTLVKLYRLCDSEIPLYPATDITDKESTGAVIREALLVTLKVLINLTHHFSKKSMGSSLIGSKPGIVDASLHLLLQIPHYIPEQKKFELGVLVLMLLINLIQDNDNNKRLLVNAKAPADFESIFACDKSALEALIKQFYHCEELARMAERRTDAILDGEKDTEAQSQPKSHEEFIEETVAKLLQKAGTHMEYTFLASYITMLIGFLIMENPQYEENVRQYLKGHTFRDMVDILKKFFSFMNLTASTDASNVCQIKATEVVIKYMEECDNKTLALTEGTGTSSAAAAAAASTEHTQNLDMSS